MSIFSYLFSFLCSQDPLRSFAIDGHLPPFCQRCTGVYLGLGITCLFLVASRLYKKGLPSLSVIYVNIASLLIMPIFGFHLLDPGPAWRFWSGLIYGNAVASLLLPATFILCKDSRVFGQYTNFSTLKFFVLFAFLNTLTFWFPIRSTFLYYVVLILAFTGLFCVLFCLIAIPVCFIKRATVSFIMKGLSNGYAKNGTCHRY